MMADDKEHLKKKNWKSIIYLKVPPSPPTTSDRKVGTGKEKHLGRI
jgi:hypothetical protein